MQISSFRDLEKYGINPLTGEACAYSLRLLCDVNEDGKQLLERYFGNTITIQLGSNWNSKVNNKPAIGSIMLPNSIFQSLATFIAFYAENCFAVILHKGTNGIIGCTEEELNEYLSFQPYLDVRRNYAHRSNSSITTGDRNIHQMSGRVS
jgi:hypothetical protein